MVGYWDSEKSWPNRSALQSLRGVGFAATKQWKWGESKKANKEILIMFVRAKWCDWTIINVPAMQHMCVLTCLWYDEHTVL